MLACFAWSTTAQAGHNPDLTRKPLGWSKSGKTLLVKKRVDTETLDSEQLELWRLGAANPAGCYNTYRDPNRKVRCDEESFQEDWDSPVLPSSIPAMFGPAPALDARYIRATRHPLPDDVEERDTIVVHIWTGKGWREVWRGVAKEQRFRYDDHESDDPADLDEWATPLTVEVVPAPDGRKAALLVQSVAEVFEYHDDLHWIDLPRGARRHPKSASAPSRALRSMAFGPVSAADRRKGARQNSAGLALHRAGNYAEAAQAFEEALAFNPRNAMARYNYACALNRLGRPELAMAELVALAGAPDCTKCQQRLVRAREDEDLRSLHADPAFVGLAGLDAPD
ncbi:MAG: tetratricopeptide repeat protein [Myxococcota bacterium]